MSLIRWSVPAIGLLVCPFVIVETMLQWRLHSTFRACDAVVMDDECHYWNEIDTYRRFGFRGGYFVDAEKTAAARWTRFGPHGPAFPVLYGTLSRLFGWGTATGALFNLGVLAASMIAWLVLVRPSARQLAITLFIVATFWPMLLYLPATLQEVLHCAIAFVLAGLAQRSINRADGSGWSFWPVVAATALVSLVRITWALVLIPLAVLAIIQGKRSTRVLVPIVGLLLIPALFLIWQRICSPYPNFLGAAIEVAGDSRSGLLQLLLDHAYASIVEWFSFNDRPLELLQRYEVTGLVLVSAMLAAREERPGLRTLFAIVAIAPVLVALRAEILAGVLLTIVAAWRLRDRLAAVVGCAGLTGLLYVFRSDVLFEQMLGSLVLTTLIVMATAALLWIQRELLQKAILRLTNLLHLRGDWRPYLFVGLNLGLLLCAVVTLYDVQDWRDYRVVAPHLLLSLLVMAAGGAWRRAAVVALVNLMFFPAFVSQFERHHRIRVDAERTARVIIDLRADLVYDPAAESPWDNTLLVPEVDLSNRVRVPTGIGVCWLVPFAGGGRVTLPPTSGYFVDIQRVGENWLALPPKSKYVFATPAKVRAWQGCHLRVLKEMPSGTLYWNPDAAVPGTP